MSKLKISTALLLIMVLPNVVAATISNKSLNKLMTQSGIEKQVSQLPAMVNAGVMQASQQGASIPKAEFSAIQKSISSAFHAPDILAAIRKQLKNKLSESDAKSLFVWYQSSLGKRITQAEEQAATPAAYQDMMGKAQVYLNDKERVNLAQQIDRLVNATDMTMQLQENTGTAVFTAISSAMNPGQPVNIKAYKDQMAAQAPQMEAQIQQLVILSYAYSYKDISIANIKKYITFLKRPVTRKFNDAGLKGMVNGLNQAIDKMAGSLAQTFKNNAKTK